MKTIKTLAAILMASIAVHAWAGECESPSDYVRKVFSADAQVVQYELDPSLSYKEITIEFFGKRGQVRRKNTIVKLDSPRGTFSIPEQVFIPSAQLWFNFVVSDSSGCKMWSLVNEVPIQGAENLIGIGNPSGEGDAFFLKEKR